MVQSAKKFYTNFYKLSKELGEIGYDYQVRKLDTLEKDLLEKYDEYNITNPEYKTDRMVNILEDE
jgi:hypothetical protein